MDPEELMTTDDKINELEANLYRLEKAVICKVNEFSMKLRTTESGIVYPGESIMLQTGIGNDLLEDYEETVRLTRLFETRSWLRVSPYLIKTGVIAKIDLMNFSQYCLARQRQIADAFYHKDKYTGINVQDIRDLRGQLEGTRVHVAHEFQKGDMIATLTLRRKR